MLHDSCEYNFKTVSGYSLDSVFGWNDKSSFMINIASFESGEKQWTCCHAE